MGEWGSCAEDFNRHHRIHTDKNTLSDDPLCLVLCSFGELTYTANARGAVCPRMASVTQCVSVLENTYVFSCGDSP